MLRNGTGVLLLTMMGTIGDYVIIRHYLYRFVDNRLTLLIIVDNLILALPKFHALRCPLARHVTIKRKVYYQMIAGKMSTGNNIVE
jgi:hypothetical protein